MDIYFDGTDRKVKEWVSQYNVITARLLTILMIRNGLVLSVRYVRLLFITGIKKMGEKIFFVTTRQARQNMGMFYLYCTFYCFRSFPNQLNK